MMKEKFHYRRFGGKCTITEIHWQKPLYCFRVKNEILKQKKKKNYLNIFFRSKERLPVLILFQLLIYPLITPSFVIIDFKIRRRAAHLFICLSLQREGQRRKGGYFLVSAASKLRSKLRAKYLQREDSNTNILLT